ncbi:sigma-70 family RNA polymerase sigma factor, partial [Anaerolineae bacterium CFX9]|nr:sigma-70 family RNA polymerase sigma factor [Anaerolineae bacterium CFX9]
MLDQDGVVWCMLTVMVPREEIRAQIVEKARKQGGISYDELLALLPDAERDLNLLEEVMEDLLDAGIEVSAGEGSSRGAAFDSNAQMRDLDADIDLDLVDEEPDEYALWVDDNLTDDAGYQQALDSDDVVGLYLKEAGRVPLLTAEEEVSLAKRMEKSESARQMLEDQGDRLPLDDVYTLRDLISDGELAQEHLVRANARLVISVAKKYIGRGVPFLDLIQEGNIGLIRATKKFDYRRGHKFSTYATWWIRQAVSRAVADQGRTIRVPVHMGDQLNRMRRIQMRLTQELGRDPSIDELALGMETTPDKIENLLEIARRPVSLETPIDEEGDSTFGDFVEDVNSPAPAEEVATNLLHEQLKTALDRLPPHVDLPRVGARLAAAARLLLAAERAADLGAGGAHVDVGDAAVGALEAQEALGLGHAVGEDARGQALRYGVLERDGLLDGLVLHHVQDGREGLGLDDGRAVVDLHDGGLHERAPAERRLEHLAAVDDLAALTLRGLERLLVVAHGGLVDQRPHQRLRIEGVADGHLLVVGHELVQEGRVDALVDDQPARGGAALARRAHGAEERGRQRSAQVGLVGDDQRVVAAELQDGAAEPLAHDLADVAAELGRARRADQSEARVLDDALADAGAPPDDHRRDGGGHSRGAEHVPGDVLAGDGAQRRLARRLPDDRIAAHERQRAVPRPDG